MDIGIDRKLFKTKPGIHVHFYSSQSAKTYTLLPSEVAGSMLAEELCIHLFTNHAFQFYEIEPSDGDSEYLKIYPGSLHLFQLWSCDSRQYLAPNDEIRLIDQTMSTEFVLRIRFHYPSSLQELNFYDVRDSGAFYYYFVQCRQDFIHDMLHDVYHSHVKEDLSVGLALVDMCRLAFEKHYNLKQLKEKFEYHNFLPRHVAKKIKGIIVKRQLTKSLNTSLEETYNKYINSGDKPHRNCIVSYLKKLLASVPEYASEHFEIINEDGRGKLAVHPYCQKPSAIYLDRGKNGMKPVGNISSLTAIDITGETVLLHFTDSKPQQLEFTEVCQSRSFVALLEGYYRLAFDYHYCLSNQIYSPMVKLWNVIKCYGPLSLHSHGKDGGHKDYLKVIWRRNAHVVCEGSFLIKQRSSSFTDYVMILHKMGLNFPAMHILYNPTSKTYTCDESVLKQIFQSHPRELHFNSVKELIKYYRSGDCSYLKLTNQLSPVPREELPLMLCRERSSSKAEPSAAASLDLQSLDGPAILSHNDLQMGNTVYGGLKSKGISSILELKEGFYGKERILVTQVNPSIGNHAAMTLCLQQDVQKAMRWKHDNIVRVYGFCLYPFLVISQRMMEGKLDVLLRKFASSVQLHHCIQVTGQIAQALDYLKSQTCTHGLIRCSNILVSSFNSHGEINVKLTADMMAAHAAALPLTDRTNTERLPWIALERWTNLANETTESDVYSFGMTVWEIFSYGDRPLSFIHSIDQLKIFIESDERSIAMPSSIEKFITSSSSAEKCNSLINVIYERLITANISADPSGRMNPQDILRETIILNCKFTEIAYEHVAPVPQLSSHHQAGSAAAAEVASGGSGISEDNHHRLIPATTHSTSLVHSRPLPSLPTSPHIIDPADLIGLESTDVYQLGQGFYGEVYKCKLRQRNGKPTIRCAVKMLKNNEQDDHTHEKELRLKEFERELKLMVSLTHKNIVQVFGECFYTYSNGKESFLIVMEYIGCGSLSIFVKNGGSRLGLDEKQQLYKKFCLDIAEGMLFLHSLNDAIIHRDLAARNVLVTDQPHVAKITDFGLARILGDEEYYRCKENSQLPWLWCAPESLSSRKFTKASDVWSYAVVLWEMYSGGKRPYISSNQLKTKADGNMDIGSLIDVLESSAPNSRLPKLPMLSPDLYSLMTKCWQTEPLRRPTFESICSQLRML